MRRALAVASAVASVATAVLIVPAQTATAAPAEEHQIKSCTARGDKITFNFHQTRDGDRRTADLDYRVSNNHRNHGNLSLSDHGGIYHSYFRSPDAIRQDGEWHHFARYYRHPYNQVSLLYIFDQAGPDYVCTIDFHM